MKLFNFNGIQPFDGRQWLWTRSAASSLVLVFLISVNIAVLKRDCNDDIDVDADDDWVSPNMWLKITTLVLVSLLVAKVSGFGRSK